MRVTLIGHKLNIILETVGVTVHWDGRKMVSIEATAGVFNRTAGLCGTMDQNGANDFMSKDGTVHKVSVAVRIMRDVKRNFELLNFRHLQHLWTLGERLP